MEPPVLKLPPAVAIAWSSCSTAARGARPSRDAGALGQPVVDLPQHKAKRELGWTTSPHEDTIEATVQWYLEREGGRVARGRRSQPIQYKLAARALSTIEDASGLVRRLRPF